jgi:hypothetical protein
MQTIDTEPGGSLNRQPVSASFERRAFHFNEETQKRKKALATRRV